MRKLASHEALFIGLIPFLIMAATVLFACGPSISERLQKSKPAQSSSWLMFLLLFLFSIYGGYFGAGLGIILLAIVQIMGFADFHVANSLKNLLATSFTLVSIVIFGFGGIIAWPEAFTMMIGSSVGGYVGGRVGRLINQRYLRLFVIGFGVILSLVYFYRVFVKH